LILDRLNAAEKPLAGALDLVSKGRIDKVDSQPVVRGPDNLALQRCASRDDKRDRFRQFDVAGKLQAEARLGGIADRALHDTVAIVEDDSPFFQGGNPLVLSLIEANLGLSNRRHLTHPCDGARVEDPPPGAIGVEVCCSVPNTRLAVLSVDAAWNALVGAGQRVGLWLWLPSGFALTKAPFHVDLFGRHSRRHHLRLDAAGTAREPLKGVGEPIVPFPLDLRGRQVPVLLVIALVCLVAGLTLPIMEVSNLWVFRGAYSIVDGIVVLIEQGDIFIAAVVAIFSVLLPTAKILGLLALWRRVDQGRHLSSRLPALLEAIGKWSMLDVFVVALMVFAAKASMLADANVAPAVIPFVASIVLTIYCSRSIKSELAAADR